MRKVSAVELPDELRKPCRRCVGFLMHLSHDRADAQHAVGHPTARPTGAFDGVA